MKKAHKTLSKILGELMAKIQYEAVLTDKEAIIQATPLEELIKHPEVYI